MNSAPQAEPETLLEFPCDFPIKAFGLDTDDFEKRVLEIVVRHTLGMPPVSVSRRMSNGGRYLAITVTIRAHSKHQLDSIYQDLTDCPEIMMAM